MGNAQLTKPRSVAHHSLSNIRPLQYRPFFYGFLILQRGKKALPFFTAWPQIPSAAFSRRSETQHTEEVPGRSETREKRIRSARFIVQTNDPHEVRFVPPCSQVFQQTASAADPMPKHACDCVITPCRRQLPTERDSYSLLQLEASCPC